MKTGVIIPCYNEENRIDSKAFLKFINENDDYHVCFVNDGSKDNTMKVLDTIKSESSNEVSIVNIKRNKGKASAVRAGARYLFNRKDVNYIGFIDADLSTSFSCFKKLVKIIDSNKKLSLVYGSRKKDKGKIEKNPFRNFFSKLVKAVVLLILGLPIEDTQCGAKVFTSSMVPIVFEEKFLTKWLFDVEIFIKFKKYYGARNVMNHIFEHPLDRWTHVDDSKLGLRDSVEIPLRLLQVWYSYSFNYTTFCRLELDRNKIRNYQLNETKIAA